MESIRIWDQRAPGGQREWEAVISEQDLRKLLDSFIKLMIPILKKYERA